MKRSHNPRSNSRSTKATTSAPDTARTYHLVDVENLCGSGHPELEELRATLSSYASSVGLSATDQGRASMSYYETRRFLFELPSQLRWVVAGTGHDAADDALLFDCDPEHLASRFNRIVLATGDHRFAGLAAELRSRGMHVTVAVGKGALAPMLAAQADEIISLAELETALEPSAA